MLKKILYTFVLLILVLTLAIIGFLYLGPISSPKAIFSVVFGFSVDSPSDESIQQAFQVPEGFSVGQYASGLPHIRFMAVSDQSDLLVSQPRQSRVLLLKRDNNNDGKHDGVITLIDGLTRPHGILLHKQWLYIAESNAIGRIEFDQTTGSTTGDYKQIVTGLTDNGNHWGKSILVHNQKLLVSMGSTCNVCEEEDKRRATIMQFDLDGSNGVIYATGLRNSVGLATTPWSNEVYATDNGRDLLGDDYPPCEVNKIEVNGFYGWPYINGFGDLDPDLGDGKQNLLETALSPVFGFRAHNAPLGIEFIKDSTVPDGYSKTALVALHGSWNRSTADGYKVVALDWQDDGSITSRDFMTGFEKDGDIIGRPVDIVEGKDGCLFVSDDYSGTVYRVCYGVQQQGFSSSITTTTDEELLALTDAEIQTESSKGEDLYKKHHCQNCHRLADHGSATGKRLDKLNTRYTMTSLSEYFLTPNPPMPQFELSQAERVSLSVYLLKQN
jgi:glucose/arabinose dehydrogenase